MPQWGNTDDTANSVLWGVGQYKQTVNTANRDAFFGNTTANAYFDGVTVGQYGMDVNEARAARASGLPRAAHAGYVVRTEGQGGRAGRVSYEVLVAHSSITSDAADDAVLPDLAILFLTQPADATANGDDDEVATFTVSTATVPPGGTVTYLWQYTTDPGNTASFATTAAVSGFAGQTTTTLSVNANTIADGTLVRVIASATGAANVTSDSALLTVTGA
jgi:hypothetical protein